MSYSAGPLDTNYDWFWSTYNPESEYDNIVNDINNMGLMPDGGQAGDASGFMMDFNELNDMFNLVDKDIYSDTFDAADRAYLESIGLDANRIVDDAFGSGANAQLDNFNDIGLSEINSLNPSAARKAIIADMEVAAEARLEAAAEELYYQTQKRGTDSFRNQINKFRGFLSAEYDITPGSSQPVGVGSYFDKENKSKQAYQQAVYDYQKAVDDFLTDPGYDGRFDVVDTREQILSDDGETMIDNPNFGKSSTSEVLINNYTYAPYAKTEEETKELVERDLLNIEGLTGEGEILDSGERATALGKFIAVGLDAVGFSDLGTKLYLTQSTWNATVNALEGAVNKLFGTAYDFNLTFNAHELAAGLLNEKFVDKDGKPILEGLADKSAYLIPFISPDFALNLAFLGGDDLKSYTPTGENLIDNMVDNLLEGPIMDRVQELSDEGKFEGVESTRGKGIMGFVDDVSAFIQRGGAEMQKIFSPGLSQAIVDFTFFDGLPGGAVLAGIGQALGPQNAEQWVRYLESKGIDKNNVEEKDISYYRQLLDNFFGSPSEEPTVSNFQQVMSNIDGGGYTAKYLNTLDEYIHKNYGLSIDQMQPADLVTILSKESRDAQEYGIEAVGDTSFAAYELYRLLAAADPDTPVLTRDEFNLQRVADLNLRDGIVEIGNGFVIDQDLVNRLKVTTGLEGVDNQKIENNFEYIISDGARGERLDSQYYNEDLELSNPVARASTDVVDPGTIILPDVDVVGYNFEYLTNPNGPDVAYDPLSGISYEFDQDRFINNPGQKDDRYLFPSATLEDLRTSNIFLDGEKLRELAKQGRVEYGELLEYVKENPLAYLELDDYGFKKNWVQDQIEGGLGLSNIAVFEGPSFYDENGNATQEFLDLLENNPELLGAWGTGTGNTGKVYGWARAEGLPKDRLFVTSADLAAAGIDPYTTPELTFAGKLDYSRNAVYEFIQASDYVVTAYNDPAVYAETKLQLSDIGEYFIKKYTGDINKEGIFYDIRDELRHNQRGETLADKFQRLGYTDATGDVSLSNTDYVEDYTEETIYRLADYEIFNAYVTYYEDGQPVDRPQLFVEDLSTGIVESYDPDKLRNDQYNFKATKEYDFPNVKIRTADGGFSIGNRDALTPVLENLYARGLLTKDQVRDADFRAFEQDMWERYSYRNYEGEPVDFEGNRIPDYVTLYEYEPGFAGGFAFDEDGEFLFMEDYEIPTDTIVSPIEDGFIFSELPDFNVVGFDNLDDLEDAYQGRLQFINQSNFDYEQKEFLRNSAFNLYSSRKSFIELDESSQKLILDAQENATSDFVDLGVFIPTSSTRGKLDAELTERLNLINAADLSEEQKQYETDLANAIFNAKASEIATIGQKNSTILTLTQQKNSFESKYGSASDQVKNLQDRIDKIETYEIPEFNVTAYMNAEDPSAYMQNFVNEVMKGTTEEFGNVLSIENADQILFNVAALAQSETDLQIVTTERDANYQKYLDETERYKTAISEKESAEAERDANATRITELKAQLYVELDNFEVTATDIDGAQSQLNDFNAEIDRMVTDGEITSEQGELEKSLATNSFNVFKATKEIAAAQAETEELQTFSLPEFNVTATNQVELDAYLDSYQTYVDDAEKAGNISAEQAINFDTIIASIRNNGSKIFTLEADNATKQGEITRLEGVNTGLSKEIDEKKEDILDLTGTISVIATGFDVTLYDDISELDTGLADYIQGINDSDLDEDMKASQIAFAESMADMRRENLYVPTYEAPDFNVIAEGDLTGLNQSYSEAMFTLDSFLDNEYITQEEYDTFVNDLNTSYNTRKDEVVPTYELPEFTVSELDSEGGFSNLEAEKEEFKSELLGFLTNEYISQAEYEAFSQQIDDAFENKRREITPIYDLPDFSVYETLQPGQDFTDIDTEYNNALDTLNTNARLGYMTTSEYIAAYEELNDSYESARKGIAPVYQLPDFSTFGQIAEGDDTTAIDDFYQNELSKLEQYKDSGYISLSEYYGFLGDLETEYSKRRKGILPTYTMPDFGVTPASSLAELAEMEKAALDRFEMFSKSGYFPEDFDILAEQRNLQNLIDAERARIKGTYTLPEFTVTDTKGVLTQEEIEDLFSEYEEGLSSDVLEGLLGFDDFRSAMEGAKKTFDFEFERRKPIQPREGGYTIIPDAINEDDDDQPSTGDFLDYVDDGNFPDQYLKYPDIGGIDTSGILTGNYMAKLDPAYQLAEILLGQDRARQMYPTGKSRGLADEEFQDIVSQFMLGQAEDAFDMQSGLSGKMQDLATEQRRLQRQADLDLMAEFGDPYRKQLEELYPEQAAALKQQREIADIAAERAKGDLSPREQAQVEQQGYLFGATRGRDVDPFTLYRALGEETSIREGRETSATNQLTTLMNMERGLYGDLPGVIGTQSPFIEGVGDITTPFNIGGIMDLGSTDFANQQRLQETNMAIAQLQRDYDTAVALRQPSKAEATLVKLNKFKAQADALSAGLSAGVQAFGTLGSILGGVTSGISSLFGGQIQPDYDVSTDKDKGYYKINRYLGF